MSIKYPGYNENDTSWDEHHKKNGEMTNREFFSSNAKGGFYEGMEWDGEEWVPDANSRARDRQREQDNRCSDCGGQNPYCECY